MAMKFARITRFLSVLALCLNSTLAEDNQIPTRVDKIKQVKQPPRGLGFLAAFALPVPWFAYNGTDAKKNKEDVINLNGFINNANDYMSDSYDESYWFEPFWEVCPSNFSALLSDNDPCPNATYVSPRYYAAEDLTWYLPRDACRTFSPPDGSELPDCPAWISSFLTSNANATHNFHNSLKDQVEIAKRNRTTSRFRLIADYMGVGIEVDQSCKSNVNQVLDEASEFDKAASAAAVTLMALVPTLLTLGNLFVPRSSEVFSTSFLVGIMTAMFSLGLPVKSISGIDSSQNVNPDTFECRARRELVRLGREPQKKRFDPKLASGTPGRQIKISDLQKWSDYIGDDGRLMTEQQIHSDCAFSQLKESVKDGWIQRAHGWHVPSAIIATLQMVLFLTVIGPLFLAYGTPQLLFDCGDYWTSIWLVMAAGISAVSRLLMWETGVHERVKAYALSRTTIATLRQFVKINDPAYLGPDSFLAQSTETELPPLYPPLIQTILRKLNNIGWLNRRRRSPGHVAAKAAHAQPKIDAHKTSFVGRAKHSLILAQDTIVRHICHPMTFLKSGMASNTPPGAARRWRPLIVLMHLSTDGRNPIVTLFTGLVEGVVLILLTVFFGSQWGANLFVLLYSITILLVAITAGRMLGLFYVIQSAKIWGLHIIETKDTDQIRGCLRIICSMKEVLIHVNGAWYFEGHRLDQRDRWQVLQKCYNAGHLDDEGAGRICGCELRPVSTTAPLTNIWSPV